GTRPSGPLTLCGTTNVQLARRRQFCVPRLVGVRPPRRTDVRESTYGWRVSRSPRRGSRLREAEDRDQRGLGAFVCEGIRTRQRTLNVDRLTRSGLGRRRIRIACAAERAVQRARARTFRRATRATN